jgi:hypothetical protein
MTGLVDKISSIRTKEHAADFVAMLRNDLVAHKERLAELDARWLFRIHRGMAPGDGDQVLEQQVQPATWRAVAAVLHAGSIYEWISIR